MPSLYIAAILIQGFRFISIKLAKYGNYSNTSNKIAELCYFMQTNIYTSERQKHKMLRIGASSNSKGLLVGSIQDKSDLYL